MKKYSPSLNFWRNYFIQMIIYFICFSIYYRLIIFLCKKYLSQKDYETAFSSPLFFGIMIGCIGLLTNLTINFIDLNYNKNKI